MILIGQTQIWRLKSGTDKPTELELLDHHLNNFIFVFDQALINEDKLKIKLDYNFSSTSELIIPVSGKNSKSDYLCQNK